MSAGQGVCRICGRELVDHSKTDASDPAMDCGGDCWGCVREIEERMGMKHDENGGQSDPTVHERDGWKWINRCPVCGEETKLGDDDLWWCVNGHHADYPNTETVERPHA